jgi:hypothetical protein
VSSILKNSKLAYFALDVNEGHGGWIEKWYYALNIGVVRIEALVGGYVPFNPPVVNDLVSYTLWPFNN